MAEANVALSLLKANLGFFDSQIPEAVETHLLSRLEVAETQLRDNCGIYLTPGRVPDEDLKAMYAAWLYRKAATGEAKPPMLQQEIRNRQIHVMPIPED